VRVATVKLVDADTIVASLPTASRIVASPGCGSPLTLLESLNRHAAGHRVYSGLQLDYPFLPAIEAGTITHYSWHVMGPIRRMVDSGSVHYIPTRASEVPHHLERWGVDTAFLRVSPPDDNGNVSLGPCGSYPIEAAMRCATVVAEVDENVPFTFGNQFPVDRITHFVASTRPMPLYELGESNDVSRRIANNVMPLIANGATLQIGIGSLPEAITGALLESGHRNLRFVGMGSDIMADFAARGMLTTDDVITALFAVELMGTRIVMDFAHRNPMVNVVSSLRGHNVTLLSSLPNFISINSAIEVDLTGQINAESVGTQQISGVGGSVDYVETAYQSRGGHRVTVIQSTAKGGVKSSIVPRLGEGTTTSIPRSMADIIVTEHGVADLRGKSTHERAEAMVAIADPPFRDELAQHIASSATRQSQ